MSGAEVSAAIAAPELRVNYSAPAMSINPGTPVAREYAGGRLTPATTETLGGIIVGEDLLISESGVLSIDKATSVEDNTRPITAAAVYAEVGNIDVLLQTI